MKFFCGSSSLFLQCEKILQTTKILIKSLSLLLVLALPSCANQGSFITDQKDGWFNDYDKGLVYCRANVKDKTLADPVCFEAGFQRYEGGTVTENKNQ
jgi:hypothetical protein